MVLAAFGAETDRQLRAGERLRLSEVGDPELAVASTGVADEGGDLVMYASRLFRHRPHPEPRDQARDSPSPQQHAGRGGPCATVGT
jgi:hypothetical protein